MIPMMRDTSRARTFARFLLLAVAAAVASFAAVAPATAQGPAHRWTVGWGGSWMSYSPFLEADQELLENDITMENGVGGSVFLDRWLNRWVGLHLDGVYHRGEIRLPGEAPTLDVWAVSAGATLRPFNGMLLPLAPYVFGTGGVISYGLGGPSLRVPGAEVVFDADGTEQFLLQAGGGLDIMLMQTWEESTVGLRVEAARMMPSGRPFRFEEQEDPGRHGFWRFTLALTASVLPD